MKFGFVGLVGPTNSGKSTLLNALIGEKLGIVSRLPQTTYRSVRGVRSSPDSQIVFVDTPGFQRYCQPIPRLLNRVAEFHSRDCDLLVWVFDAGIACVLRQCDQLSGKISSFKQKSFCCLNQVDRVNKPGLLPLIDSLSRTGLFEDVIPLSAKTGDGLTSLIGVLERHLPESAPLYPENQRTDRGEDFLFSEWIREKVYETTRQELPYSVRVEIEMIDRNSSNCPTVFATLHVDSDSRKGILIGHEASMLKEIGIRARREIERHLKHQICLKLHVDVEKNWRQNRFLVEQYLELR